MRTRPSRRDVLLSAGSFAAWSLLPVLPSQGATRDPRLLVVILRGALDGLAAVMPLGDPGYVAVRGSFIEDSRRVGAPFQLDGTFALAPQFRTLAHLHAARQAIILHAVATPYRERSHFDGQEVLESGLPDAVGAQTGWLNRALAHLHGRGRIGDGAGISIGATAPLIMRGEEPILSWTPQTLPFASDETIERLLHLYRARDPLLAEALIEGVRLDAMSNDMAAPGRRNPNELVIATAQSAASLLAKSDGPRVGALSIDGWDTHAWEAPGSGRLSGMLDLLDNVFAALARGLAPVWSDTVIVVATEFGRTVHVNGTAGTDHGTAAAAFLLGGAVKGGRVIADWPGLAESELVDRRDLRPTTDLRSVFKGVLAQHLGIDAPALAAGIFPGSGNVPPMVDLIA